MGQPDGSCVWWSMESLRWIMNLNEKTLDLIEDRFIKGCLGEIGDISASVLDILRKVLVHNGRLTVGFGAGKSASSLDTPGGDLDGEDVPDYGKVINFK